MAGLRRRIIVPVRPLTPWLSSHWVGLVTPVPNAIARPLVESLIHEAVAHEHDIAEYVPDPPDGLIGFDEAVRLALSQGPRRRRGDPLVHRAPAGTPPPTRCPPTRTGPAARVYTDEREPRRWTRRRRRCGG